MNVATDEPILSPELLGPREPSMHADVIPMTIEEELELELDALLGGFLDNQLSESELSERRQLDEEIMSGIKNLLTTADGLQNIRLIEDFGQKLAEMACNHDHFAEQLERNGIEVHKSALAKLNEQAQEDRRQGFLDKLINRNKKAKRDSKNSKDNSFLKGLLRVKVWFLPE